jgi:hypothetical protein
MLEHGAVDFTHELAVDLNHVIGRYAKEIRVIGRVMDLAEAEAIVDRRNPMGFVVTDDVSCVE